MKVTSPNEMYDTQSLIDEAIKGFEIDLKSQPKNECYYHLAVKREYNRVVCDAVERLYLNAGWSRAICKPSSENGERPGLTGLQLFNDEYEKINDVPEFNMNELFHLLETIYNSQKEGILGDSWNDIALAANDWIANNRNEKKTIKSE